MIEKPEGFHLGLFLSYQFYADYQYEKLCSWCKRDRFEKRDAMYLLPGVAVRALGLMAYLIGGASLLSLIIVLFGDFLSISSIGAYASQRFLLAIEIGVLSVFALIAHSLRSRSSAQFLAKFALPTVLFSSAFLLFSLPFHGDKYVWVEPGMFAFFFLTTSVAGLALKDSGELMVCVRFFIVGMVSVCTIYGLSCINIYLFALVDQNSDFGRYLPYGFANIRYWSHVATWCLPLFPLAVLIGPLKNKRTWRLFVLTGAGMWWWILIQSMGRGSLVGIAFGSLLALSLLGKRAWPWFSMLLLHLGAGILLWLILSVFIPSVLYDGESQLRTFHAGAAGRLPLIIEAWHRSLQNFPLGMGPLSWLTEEPLTEIYASGPKFGHPHNMYLLWAAEYGWLLIACLGLLVLQAILYFWQARAVCLRSPATEAANERFLLLVGFTASVSAALVHAGVSAVFLVPGSLLVGLFVLIMFWALISPHDLKELPTTRQTRGLRFETSMVLIASAVLFFGWLVWMQTVWNYYDGMRADSTTYAQEVGRATFPRFWRHGNFPR